MSLTDAVFTLWGVFALYWLLAALTAKHGTRRQLGRTRAVVLIAGLALARVFRNGGLPVHNSAVRGVGVALLVCGLGLAVWARVYLGRNWGMPMTQKDEPELVTAGPYKRVRHPIYSGLLAAALGTVLATNLYGLIALAALAAYSIYSAKVEERQLCATFPAAYPPYKAQTKMLIPFVL
ncbi:MAG TPA: isoprenylcysteine carboxylmethyltransferase family protein [Solirubrobacteraceae bacterium]|jgi:protein-S-isoprenylcysteine O-methyltransferase Ste14|nr:isoprenylcysteine carboxylmethyltransferase family protein [Solirubrobacteraceae bacterium]